MFPTQSLLSCPGIFTATKVYLGTHFSIFLSTPENDGDLTDLWLQFPLVYRTLFWNSIRYWSLHVCVCVCSIHTGAWDYLLVWISEYKLYYYVERHMKSWISVPLWKRTTELISPTQAYLLSPGERYSERTDWLSACGSIVVAVLLLSHTSTAVMREGRQGGGEAFFPSCREAVELNV